jgi:glycosyltransferase involved in cell wall biosynthesis
LTKPKLCYLATGKSVFVHNWVNHFASQGWDVALIADRPAPSKLLDDRVKQYRIPWIPFHEYPFLQGGTLLYHLMPIITYPRAAIYALSLTLVLKQLHPDLIHAHNVPRCGVPMAVASHLPIVRSPIVMTEWGPWHLQASVGLQFLLEKHAYRQADLVTTLTDDTSRILIRKFNLDPGLVKSIPWGTNLDLFHRGYGAEVSELRDKLEIPSCSPVVISYRGMNPHHGIEIIVRAIPHVIHQCPEAIFVILTGGKVVGFASTMKDLVSELGVTSNVRFIEQKVPYGEMPVYLNMSFVSLHLPSNDNGSPSISESMACAATIVATDCPGYRERIRHGETGWLVTRDPKAVSSAIVRCLRDPSIRESFFRNAQTDLLTHENWDYNMQRIEEIYQSLIATGGW